MKFKEITKDKLKRKYEFTLKASDLNKEVDQQLEKEQPSIQMKGFRKGLQKISREYKLPLIGGDLVKGPLQISVTVIGKPQKRTLLRSNAKPGDILCLSGELGRGYIGLREFKNASRDLKKEVEDAADDVNNTEK